jgi:TonB family protein
MRGSARRALLAALLAMASPATPAAAADGESIEIGAVRAVAQDAVPPGPRLDDRLREIRERIQAAVVFPPLARMRRLEGVAQVRFEIAADGRPREIAVADSTGHAILDRAALAAVEAAAPLPWVYGLLEVPVRFELSRRQ